MDEQCRSHSGYNYDRHEWEQISAWPHKDEWKCRRCSTRTNQDPTICDCPGGPIMVNPSTGTCCSCSKKAPEGY